MKALSRDEHRVVVERARRVALGPIVPTGLRAVAVVYESTRYIVLVPAPRPRPDEDDDGDWSPHRHGEAGGLVFTPDEARVLATMLVEASS